MHERSLMRGKYVARFADGPADLSAALALRLSVFRSGKGVDEDELDRICLHLLVEDRFDHTLVCCCRLLPLADGAEIARSYSAQHYDLSALSKYPAPMLELGRFCVAPGAHDPDILRMAWAALTAFVDETGTELLFGCSSFAGTEAAAYRDAFALLYDRHLAPSRWRPNVKSPQVVPLDAPCQTNADPKRAMLAIPALLRTYLALGGWVSDHAVVDPDLDTLHVFTGLEIARIPDSRKRLLRAVAS